MQGYEIAKTIANFGAKTTLISGPTALEPPTNVNFISVESGDDFLKKSIENLPADIFISVAAISDWKANKIHLNKIKKEGLKSRIFNFKPNVDVLKQISSHKRRPLLVIGFSAETKNLLLNSKKKLTRKKCDWIIANKISKNSGFKSENNKVFFIENNNIEEWKLMKKKNVSIKLVKKIVSFFKNH